MNHGSMLNNVFQEILDFIVGYFSIIPKIIYFLFASFMAGIDAMQALIRKIAGLDTYHVGGTAVVNQDPLTEFIYGILGIGNSAPAYRGLNVVFWSLAIFGVIVLVITTIVAIIKSHYNEDAEGTNPVKYVYTALKAIFTFAIIPVIVVVGMMLSTFLLKTADNITSGYAGAESVKGIYGADAEQIFKGEGIKKSDGTEDKVYGHYDMFGYGSPTTSTTFGGMMFKACAYSANRIRSVDDEELQDAIDKYVGLKTEGEGGYVVFGSANCSAYTSLQTKEEKKEYIAYQIDYAFMNALEFAGDGDTGGLDYGDTGESLNEATGVSDKVQLFKIGRSKIWSFTKFDVELVWLFYNLWTFNYIVAFGGGITIFGILISIILGLMTRLIKGAAMFLIYPALLGIAPLDNFKAFKNWGTTFIQQIMMAFGAIIGINVVMLILPYVNNMAFFGNPVLDAIVNVIVIIAGLMLAKDFISMVSGFVGGADASAVGEGVKGGVAGAIKTGAGVTVKAGAAVAKTGLRINKAAVKLGAAGVKTGVAKVKTRMAVKRARDISEGKYAEEKASAERDFRNMRRSANASETSAENRRTDALRRWETDPSYTADQRKAVEDAGKKAYNKVIKKNGSEADAQAAKRAAEEKEILHQTGADVEIANDLRLAKDFRAKQAAARKKYDSVDESKVVDKNHLVKDADGKYIATKASADVGGIWDKAWLGKKVLDEHGHEVIDEETGKVKREPGGILGDVKNVGKTIGDGFVKTVGQELGPALGLDKLLKGVGSLMKDSLATTGVQAWQFKAGGRADRFLSGSTAGQFTKKIIEGVASKVADPKSKKTGDDLQRQLADEQKARDEKQTAATSSLATAVENQGAAIRELVEEMRRSGSSGGGSGGSGGGGGSTP